VQRDVVFSALVAIPIPLARKVVYVLEVFSIVIPKNPQLALKFFKLSRVFFQRY